MGTFLALGHRAGADHDLPGPLRPGAAEAYFGFAIADIRSGRAERLEGEFPVEIAPLARETNALIDANRAIVERARTHVGNLAHAIKTPLSVIVNEAAAHPIDPFANKVLEQADVMRDQVAHHSLSAATLINPHATGCVVSNIKSPSNQTRNGSELLSSNTEFISGA